MWLANEEVGSNACIRSGAAVMSCTYAATKRYVMHTHAKKKEEETSESNRNRDREIEKRTIALARFDEA